MTCIKETSLIEWKSNYGWTDGQTWEKLNGLDIHYHWYKTRSNISDNVSLDIQNCRYSIDSLHFKMLYILDKHRQTEIKSTENKPFCL
jgi:hypothetical protein